MKTAAYSATLNQSFRILDWAVVSPAVGDRLYVFLALPTRVTSIRGLILSPAFFAVSASFSTTAVAAAPSGGVDQSASVGRDAAVRHRGLGMNQ
jgi:hypothetical protein